MKKRETIMVDHSSNPLVSVIVPMFNAELYIKDALDSIFNQTYRNIEVVVVDDGSTDKSKDIVMNYRSNVKYLYQPNSGGYPSRARNTGLINSSGDLITFFDSDDVMHPRKIELQVDFLKKNPDISIVLVDYVNFIDSVDYERTHFQTCPTLSKLVQKNSKNESFSLKPDEARKILTYENYATSNSPLLRRELLNDIGMFDESLIIGEDIEFIYRIATKYNIGILNIIGFKRRLHENNISRNSIKMLNESVRSREKILMLEENDHIRKKLSIVISNLHLSLCENYIGIDNKTAFKELAKSFYLTPFRLLQAKKISKIVLSLAGLYQKTN